MKLTLLALGLFSTSAMAWPSSRLSCSGPSGNYEGHPIYMKLDFQMISGNKATGTMAMSEQADGPWTQGCTTPSPLVITPVSGQDYEIDGTYTCVQNSGGQADMMFDPNAMTMSAGSGSDTITYACEWQ